MTDAAGRLSAALAGRYAIVRELGQGGMATVFLAQDLKHDRKVAIKVLRPELAAVIGAERFLREIKTIANLQHPHILGLIDSGEVEGTAYYVMPFMEGESLRDRISREKQLPIPDAIRLASEVAAALDYAHRHGIVHRDIKPENVLLHDGSALVADFGIALAMSKSGGTRMTETGMSLGTPHYMSPEQAMGEREITARSDVYALGAMTYEMLTGDPPFTGSTAQAIVAKVMTEKPASIRKVRDRVPEAMEEAVYTALEKLPADRFATAAEFAAALKGDGTGSTMRSRSTGTPSRPPRALQVAGTIAMFSSLAALALGVKLLNPKPQPVTRLTLDIPELRVNHIGYYGNAIAIAPDGSRMAFVVGGEGAVSHLAVRERGSLDLKVLPGTDNADGPFFSPDGTWIGYYALGKIFKVPAAGGPPVQLTNDASTVLLFGAWRSDNTIIYSTPAFSLMSVPASGGTPTQIVPAPTNGGAGFPTALPRSDALLMVRCGNNCSQPVLFALDLKTRKADTVLVGGVRSWYLPSGMLVVVRGDGTVVGAPFDLDKLRFTSEPAVLLTNVQLELELIPELAIADDGTLVYLPANLAARSASVAEVSRSGRSRLLDPNWLVRFSSMSLSPDGQRLAVSIIDKQNGGALWVKQLDNGPLTRLTFDGTINYRAAWLPDNRSLVFSSDRDPKGSTNLYRIRADGSDKPERLFPADTSQIDESEWSRDGQWVVYRTGVVAGVRDVYARRTSGDTTRLTIAAGPSDEYNPALSPDGKWIAYVSLESGQEEVYVRPFPDVTRARWQVSPSGGTSPVWAHSGKELFYLTNDSLVSATVTATPDFRVTGRQALFNTRTYIFQPWHQSFSVKPGDQSFIMQQRPLESDADARRLTVVLNWFSELRRPPAAE
ncbi:MAG: protein kinase [Gemmatimonadales bacterium]